tara:strand:+ start:863 stop:1483 length:621 start_codon:yes stop_codon:yes gene_type:complete
MDYKLHNSWVVWYHNPSDDNWDIKSYENVYEINNLMELCKFQNSKHLLPPLSETMYFIMRKKNEYEYVYPMWEDENNKKGGCWSFKIDNSLVDEIWNVFLIYLTGNNFGNTEENSNQFNGISFSPKNGFCIVKIWNNDFTQSNLESLINPEISKWLSVNECFYKSHTDNILKDKKKKSKVTYSSYVKQNKPIRKKKKWYSKKSNWK